jgi:predicted amidohydrolase/acetyl esterase/lipase
MKRMLILAWVGVGLTMIGPAHAADGPLVLDVWPGKVAGDRGKIGPERVRAVAEAPTADAKWITNVTRPTISVFRPDETNNTGVAIVICPGGGYWNLAWDKEGEEVAAWMQTLGITGVVLKYRVPRRPGEPEPLPAPGPLLDAQRAISLVRSRSATWGIDPERIGIIGFSAGGHLALMTAISFEKRSYDPVDEVDRASCKPNFAIVAYPGYILTRPGADELAKYVRIPKETGPIFIVHASDDQEPGAQPEQSLALYRELKRADVPAELHIYDRGRHGFGVRKSALPVSRWTERCADWLNERGILPARVRSANPPTHDTGNGPPRHDRLPRKVIVGTTMTRWYSDYPGLDGRIREMCRLLDEMATESRSKHGRSLDLALFTEYALTAGKNGPAEKVAVAHSEDIIAPLAAKAKEHKCYLVFGGIFLDKPDSSACSNAAAVIDRNGRLLGRYNKVHPVLDRDGPQGQIVLEGGVRPGAEYNVFDLDFGRVGVQICYDIEYPEGWRRLADKGAELVLFPSQTPQLTRPGMYAATHEYWVVSSTYRNNASFFEPGTGLIAAQIREPKQTLVHEIDLSFVILPWSTRLRNGTAFREAFGDRVGFRYSESEDRGVFWSNDPKTTIGQMARSLGLLETPSDVEARAQAAQDRLRGGPAR